jgi:tRNA pseudouridine38-40 synthase
LCYRYFIHLGFRGTHYHGWQIQPGAITVQEILNQNLSLVLKESIQTTGAGRTDAGVHAPCFYAHFDCQVNNLHQNQKIIYQLNAILPNDISVYNILAVHPTAHARFDAISRTYVYRISLVKDPFNYEFALCIKRSLNIESMNRACEILKEYTDFSSFSKLHTDVKTNNCKIFVAKWALSQNEIHFTISADRFLRNMVRAIVGTLFEVGKDKILPEDIRLIIEGKSRSLAGSSAKAHGLHLIQIQYPSEIFTHKC